MAIKEINREKRGGFTYSTIYPWLPSLNSLTPHPPISHNYLLHNLGCDNTYFIM
jgi:hypothetical protein